MLGNIGITEILLIVFILVLLFGAKKIPELMRGLGQGVKEFKEGLNAPVENKPPKSDDNPAKPKNE